MFIFWAVCRLCCAYCLWLRSSAARRHQKTRLDYFAAKTQKQVIFKRARISQIKVCFDDFFSPHTRRDFCIVLPSFFLCAMPIVRFLISQPAVPSFPSVRAYKSVVASQNTYQLRGSKKVAAAVCIRHVLLLRGCALLQEFQTRQKTNAADNEMPLVWKHTRTQIVALISECAHARPPDDQKTPLFAIKQALSFWWFNSHSETSLSFANIKAFRAHN